MLSDEEMNAIESLKNISIYMGDNYTFSQQGIRNLRKNLRIVLPAIGKLNEKNIELTNSYNQAIKETNDENRRCMLLAVENQELKEKNKNARERIEYYLVENMRLNDFDERNKELRKLEKILEE